MGYLNQTQLEPGELAMKELFKLHGDIIQNGTVIDQSYWILDENRAPNGSCKRNGLNLDQKPLEDNNGMFQQAAPDTYVYEAYFDPRSVEVTYVRIIGVSPLNATVFCHLWYPDSNTALMVKAEIYVRLYHKLVKKTI